MQFRQTLYLLLVFETTLITAQRKVISSPEECARTCGADEEPRDCYYKFTLEYYMTMNKACELCKPTNANQISNVPQCQCVEADGFERGMLSINRMLPGPSIQVCENDRIIVDVENKIEGMEVSLHWHGVWQQGSQYYDGVPFLTQCPIPSGTTFRYQFLANNSGTHFYHSHSGLQKMDGQYGSLIVRQPRTVDPLSRLYDYDLPTHVILLSDWLHEMAIERFPGRLKNDIGQAPRSVLINGKGRWKDPTTDKTTTVQIETFDVRPGKRYRFRMINSFASVCPAQLTIEGHTLWLIAQDGEPVHPVPVNTIISFSGERVDFILNANQTIGAYWIQLRGLGECSGKKVNQVAILRYAGGPAEPKTIQPGYENGLKRGKVYNPLDAKCDQLRPDAVCVSQLKSVKPISSDLLKVKPDLRITLPFKFYTFENVSNGIQDLFRPGSYTRYLVSTGPFHLTSLVGNISSVFPQVPPISQYLNPSDTCNPDNLPEDCGTPCVCPHTYHIEMGAVVEVVVYDQMSQPMLAHPFHLHGYAFKVLKMGRFPNRTTISNREIDDVIIEHDVMLKSKEYKQPPGKDTVSIPQSGYVILRFKADNPGWWLFHCHFLYHITIGMNVMFHVGEEEDVPPVPRGFPICGTFKPEIV